LNDLTVIGSTVGEWVKSESPPRGLIPIHRKQSRKLKKTLLKWVKEKGRNSEN